MERTYKPEGMQLSSMENKEYLATPQGLERAMHGGVILEAKVTLCDSRFCLHVDLPCAEGIILPEEAVYCRAGEVRKDIALITRVGKPVSFCVVSLEQRNGRLTAYLSRRMAQEMCIKQYLSHLSEGDLVTARVTHLEPFGAFLDLGCGVSSLLSVDCISVSRISHPRDRLQVGDLLTVAVKSIDRESGRIYVSLRELLGTWEENAALFESGQTVTGIIRSVETYGVFVELAPNLAGLAEIRESEVEQLRRHIGKPAAVYIKSIVPDRMKIKLVLIDVAEVSDTVKPIRYYVDLQKIKHLSHWVYSPKGANKVIETRFGESV